MKHVGYYIGIPKHVEVLLLTLCGIYSTISDEYFKAFLDLPSNLNTIWELPLESEQFSPNSQIIIKHLISGILLVKTCSVYFYLAFYIVMLWPAIFEERPVLLLPWLITGAVEGFGIGLLSLMIGIYVGISYGGYRPAFYEYLLSQLIQFIPFCYVWFCVYSFYRDLKLNTPSSMGKRKMEIDMEMAFRRRNARRLKEDLLKQAVEFDEDDRNLISASTIENRVQQLTTDLHRKDTMSWDSLADVNRALTSDDDSMSTCDDFFGDINESDLTLAEKASRILNLTKEDVEMAKTRHLSRSALFTKSMMTIDNIDQMKLPIADKNLTLKDTYSFRETRNQKSNQLETKSLQKMAISSLAESCSEEQQLGGTIDYSSSSFAQTMIFLPKVTMNQPERKIVDIDLDKQSESIQTSCKSIDTEFGFALSPSKKNSPRDHVETISIREKPSDWKNVAFEPSQNTLTSIEMIKKPSSTKLSMENKLSSKTLVIKPNKKRSRKMKTCDHSCQKCLSKTILKPTNTVLSFLQTDNAVCTQRTKQISTLISNTEQEILDDPRKSLDVMTDTEPEIDCKTIETDIELEVDFKTIETDTEPDVDFKTIETDTEEPEVESKTIETDCTISESNIEELPKRMPPPKKALFVKGPSYGKKSVFRVDGYTAAFLKKERDNAQ